MLAQTAHCATVFACVMERRMTSAHSKESYASRADNRGSAGCIFRRGLRGDRDCDGTGAEGTRPVGIPSSLASVAPAISYAVSYPFIAIIWINQPPLPDAVRRRSDAEINVDQLRPSLHCVFLPFCDRLDCAYLARFVAGNVLRLFV